MAQAAIAIPPLCAELDALISADDYAGFEAWVPRFAAAWPFDEETEDLVLAKVETQWLAEAEEFLYRAIQRSADEYAAAYAITLEKARLVDLAKRLVAAKPKPIVVEAKSKWPEAPQAPAGATNLERLTYPRGLLGHVVQYMYDTAGLPDRFMALAGALSSCGKCLDRKVLGPTGNSTVLFILVIAESGAGKQHILNCIRMVLRAAGMEEVIVASGIASVQAVEEILEGRKEGEGQPSPLVPIDEYGSFLSRISSKGQTGNVAEIPSILQTLWGWPPELEWVGSMKVGKERRSVFGPAFAIFGSSTERAFFTALRRKEVASGFVNRHTLINAGRGAPERVKPPYHWAQCPEWLVEALAEVSGPPAPFEGTPFTFKEKEKLVTVRDFRRIEWGEGAEELWFKFEKEIRGMVSVDDRELWIRAPKSQNGLQQFTPSFAVPTKLKSPTLNGQ